MVSGQGLLTNRIEETTPNRLCMNEMTCDREDAEKNTLFSANFISIKTK